MSTDTIVQGQAFLDEAIAWRKTADPEYPFAAEVNDDKCKIRINDFPADNLYTLIVNGKEIADFDDWPSQWTRPPATKTQHNLTIVAKPNGSNVTLYAIPEDVLEQFKLSPEKAFQLFPKNQPRSHEDTRTATAKAGSTGGNIQAYSNQDICYAWECDEYGNCVYVWWYC